MAPSCLLAFSHQRTGSTSHPQQITLLTGPDGRGQARRCAPILSPVISAPHLYTIAQSTLNTLGLETLTPPPWRKHGRGPKSRGKPVVQRPPCASTSPCLRATHTTAKRHIKTNRTGAAMRYKVVMNRMHNHWHE